MKYSGRWVRRIDRDPGYLRLPKNALTERLEAGPTLLQPILERPAAAVSAPRRLASVKV